MDHLPLPQNPVIGSFPIPWLITEDYDGGEWRSYPERTGWVVENRASSIAFSRHGRLVADPKAIGAFVQTWMYWGLLEKFLIAPVRIPAAVLQEQTKDGDTLLTSKHVCEQLLPRLSDMGFGTFPANQAKRLQTWMEERYRPMMDVRDMVLRIARSLQERPDDDLSRVCLSIAVLIEYLIRILSDIYTKRGLEFDDVPQWPRQQNWRYFHDVDCAQPLVEIMKLKGWCPNKLARFDVEENRSIGKLWYYANIQPPNAQQSHLRCTRERCDVVQVAINDYKTAHVNQDCDCEFQGPAPESIADGIRNGHHQCVVVSEDSSVRDGLRVSLRNANPVRRYVAISHVWADGYGNLVTNTLPRCVLRMIQGCVNACRREGYSVSLPFWMDTVCLPRYPLELRSKALRTLNEPFERAETVLVFGSYLRTVAAKGLAPLELTARVALCDWTQRLWTFAEGHVAKNVWFQFGDEAVAVNDKMHAELGTNYRLIPSSARNEVAMCIFRDFIFYTAASMASLGSEPISYGGIPKLRYALSTRSTSQALDEPLCVGALLRLDLKKIIDAEDTRKMSAVWSMIPQIPLGLVFSRASEKLSVEGFRWAPASLMGGLDTTRWQGPFSLVAKPEAIASAEGLVAELPGMLFNAGCDPDKHAGNGKLLVMSAARHTYDDDDLMYLVFRGQSRRWYKVEFKEDWHQTRVPIDDSEEEPALILEQSSVFNESKAKHDLDEMEDCWGLLVTYPRSDIGRNVIHAKAHKHVGILALSTKEHAFFDAIELCWHNVWILHHDVLEGLLKAGKRMDDVMRPWIEGHARSSDLLQLALEIRHYRSLKGSEEDAWEHCVDMVNAMAHLGQYGKVVEKPQTKWIID